jgi:hypothetical protein
MENQGLPEAGDMVVLQPTEVLADADEYHRRVALPAGATTTSGDSAPAQQRRDEAVRAFNDLRQRIETGDRSALDALLGHAAALVAPKVAEWRARWEAGAAAAAAATGEQLASLAAGDGAHLAAASVHHHLPPGPERNLGCCGTLGTYLHPAMDPLPD